MGLAFIVHFPKVSLTKCNICYRLRSVTDLSIRARFCSMEYKKEKKMQAAEGPISFVLVAIVGERHYGRFSRLEINLRQSETMNPLW